MSSPTRLAFLLHMHQPQYVDPGSGRALLPWVRLHGARGYHDVARLLDEFGGVRLTVNFVPSLVEQLQAVVDGAVDSWLEIAQRPAASWTPAERRFLLERFFSIDWNRGVLPRPRYLELLDKRGRRVEGLDLDAVAATFTDGELRDLTVLFHLAWLGFAARARSPHVDELERKGRGFDEGDLRAVVEAGRAACAEVLPLYRKLAARGQVELSTSPYYHPIVPLLCDTDAARRAYRASGRNEPPLPERFAFPDDARRQIARAKQLHRSVFFDGRDAPLGMWPPEGSVSPEAVAAYRAEGVRWLATDEGNLWRSLDAPAARGALYQAWRYDGMDLVFRDREISDRIGFSYAHGEAQAGVADLLGRVRRAGDLAREAGVPEPVVPVILDGENPWEAYPGSGEPFLRALFTELSRGGGDVRPVAIGPHLDEVASRGHLARLHSGSWIDSDFHIWIGDPVKNRAWTLLARARHRAERVFREAARSAASQQTGIASQQAGIASQQAGLASQQAGVATQQEVEALRRHLAAAEGSDWFWWFGEPFHSAEDALFDRLFRAHLAAAWRALGEPVPPELERPVAEGAGPAPVRPPRAFVAPEIDGRVGSYFEWIDAGRYDVPRGAAMAETPLLATLHFGFDARTLFLRGDPSPGEVARLRGATVELSLHSPERELTLVAPPGARRFTAAGSGEPVGAVACEAVLEIAVPFDALAARVGDRVEIALRLLEGEIALGRYPREGALEVTVPDRHFDADHWL